MLTSPPAARRAEICDCQPDWFGSDHWQPEPLTNARVKNWVPYCDATVVSVVLLRPVSTYGAKTCAGQLTAARAVRALPMPMAVAAAAAASMRTAAAGRRREVRD